MTTCKLLSNSVVHSVLRLSTLGMYTTSVINQLHVQSYFIYSLETWYDVGNGTSTKHH